MSKQIVNRDTLLERFLEDVNVEKALEVADAFLKVESDPSCFAIRNYKIARQAEAFFKKAVDPGGVPNDLRIKGLERFLEIESKNLTTNIRLLVSELPKEVVLAKTIVHHVLPPLGDVEDEMWPLCKFGPGATFNSGGPKGKHLLSKIGGPQTVTKEAIEVLAPVIRNHFPAWEETLLECPVTIVEGNRCEFVPKDVTKCRRIAVEPSLNLFLQMGIGKWLSRRLRTQGVDLTNQTRNRRLARQASIDGKLATIDLSDASDTISVELVRYLLPPDWYALLDAVRSPKFINDGEWQTSYSFSSQGNAFTFPLETLIFWALGRATCELCYAYGDDLIVPSHKAPDFYKVLEFCGFTPNVAKSYCDGNFRESCGGDYFFGIPVRPHYYKEECVRWSDVVKLHNRLIETWQYLPKVTEYLTNLVPEKFRYFGPPAFWADGLENTVTGDDYEYGNHIVKPYDWWFWSEGSIPKRRFSVTTSPYKWASLYGSGVRLRASIYASEDVGEVSSLLRYGTKRVRFDPATALPLQRPEI